MFIRNCITEKRDLVTLTSHDLIGEAVAVLQKHRLKSVPIIDDDDKFIGILSKEGLFELFEQGFEGTYAELEKQPITAAISKITPLKSDNKFEETLPIIVRYPFVPIVDEAYRLLGIVKRKDITNALESSFGVGIPGLRLLIGTPEMEGRLGKILGIVNNLHVNVITAVAFDAGDPFIRRVLLKIKPTNEKIELINRLEKNGFIILAVNED